MRIVLGLNALKATRQISGCQFLSVRNERQFTIMAPAERKTFVDTSLYTKSIGEFIDTIVTL